MNGFCSNRALLCTNLFTRFTCDFWSVTADGTQRHCCWIQHLALLFYVRFPGDRAVCGISVVQLVGAISVDSDDQGRTLTHTQMPTHTHTHTQAKVCTLRHLGRSGLADAPRRHGPLRCQRRGGFCDRGLPVTPHANPPSHGNTCCRSHRRATLPSRMRLTSCWCKRLHSRIAVLTQNVDGLH